jgi:tRNA-dihydrouridine synthase
MTLPRPFFALAPLYDVTDTVFRRMVSECAAPDLRFTEFVNVDGLQSPGRSKIDYRLKFTKSEKPIIAQIWGKEPGNYFKTAQELVEMGYGGIDINMGCPDKAVVKNGCCSALIRNHDLAAEIIEATKKGAAGKVPVSVKTRIGFREYNPDWLEFLLRQNLYMLSVHLRTVKEMSKVPAHWELASEISDLRRKISPSTLLVGNGDIDNKKQARELIAKHKLDGAMIGRGVFRDPFVFADKSPWPQLSPQKKVDLYIKHVKLFEKTWRDGQRPLITLNKFCKIYINGFDGAKEYREKLMSCGSTAELLNKLDKIKSEVSAVPRTPVGHGA